MNLDLENWIIKNLEIINTYVSAETRESGGLLRHVIKMNNTRLSDVRTTPTT